jgi:prepilin-type N-terminal cleavage/methylation domain-containing protein
MKLPEQPNISSPRSRGRPRDDYSPMSKKYGPLNDTGFTLVEILIASFILAVAIVPMVNAFRTALISTGIGERLLVFTNQAESTLNRAVVLDYDTLNSNLGDPADLAVLFGSAAEANREMFTFGGTDYTPAISIADASSGAGGLLEITVTIKEITLKTLKSDY